MIKSLLLNFVIVCFGLSVQGKTAASDTLTAPAVKTEVLKPYIAPALLITTGAIIHFTEGTKTTVRDFMQDNLRYDGAVDDYAQYAPLAAVYILNLFGIDGKNNFGNRTAVAVKSLLLNALITGWLKEWSDTERPNGDMNSFPSAHTSKAFTMAHIMHREFGSVSHWYSISGYTCAAAVGIMRMAKDAHWVSDVLAGAGIGILSAEVVYRTHQYKWDNEHIKRLDILPFQIGKNRGITLVYTF